MAELPRDRAPSVLGGVLLIYLPTLLPSLLQALGYGAEPPAEYWVWLPLVPTFVLGVLVTYVTHHWMVGAAVACFAVLVLIYGAARVVRMSRARALVLGGLIWLVVGFQAYVLPHALRT